MFRFALILACLAGMFACKDPPASSRSAAGSATRSPTGQRPALLGETPEDLHPHAAGTDERSVELDKVMAEESRAADWAGPKEQSLRTLAPQATEITCRTRTCRVVVAGTESEIFAVVDKLRPAADRVIATSPEEHEGKLLARLYFQYDAE